MFCTVSSCCFCEFNIDDWVKFLPILCGKSFFLIRKKGQHRKEVLRKSKKREGNRSVIKKFIDWFWWVCRSVCSRNKIKWIKVLNSLTVRISSKKEKKFPAITTRSPLLWQQQRIIISSAIISTRITVVFRSDSRVCSVCLWCNKTQISRRTEAPKNFVLQTSYTYTTSTRVQHMLG